jgi:hypothetical protein
VARNRSLCFECFGAHSKRRAAGSRAHHGKACNRSSAPRAPAKTDAAPYSAGASVINSSRRRSVNSAM